MGPSPMAVWLSQQAEDAVRRHAQEGYPQEICGILVGRFSGADVRVERARRAPNAATSERGARFVLHPRDLLAAEEELAAAEEIVGFYHSHPDVPASPSAADQEHAWPGYAYAIVSVLRSEARHVSVWRTKQVGGRLVEETVARG